jgi:hypothetical protein
MTHYTVNKHMNKTAIIVGLAKQYVLALRRLDIFYLLFYIFNLYSIITLGIIILFLEA